MGFWSTLNAMLWFDMFPEEVEHPDPYSLSHVPLVEPAISDTSSRRNIFYWKYLYIALVYLVPGPNLDRHILDRTNPRQTKPRHDQT